MAYEEKTKAANFPHGITLDGRNKLKITGVTEVESFDEFEVVLNTTCGELTVEGRELHVERLTVDSGEIVITGNINAIKYEDAPAPKSGIFSKLFG